MAGTGVQVRGPGVKKLRALGIRLAQIAVVKEQIATVQAEEAIDLIQEGFIAEENPYGKRWAKRKRETKRTRGRKILSGETSRLRRGWKRTAIGPQGFTISSSVIYSTFNQPKRAMVPIEGRGLPRKWRKPLSDAASDAINAYLDI